MRLRPMQARWPPSRSRRPSCCMIAPLSASLRTCASCGSSNSRRDGATRAKVVAIEHEAGAAVAGRRCVGTQSGARARSWWCLDGQMDHGRHDDLGAVGNNTCYARPPR
eukprot:4948169-Prymnesium_polylepis.1